MLKAKDIMSTDVITVSPETTVKELAKLLEAHNISGAPVVDSQNSIVGVVTEADLIDQNKKIHIPTVVTILDSVFYLENPDKMEKEMKKIAGTSVAEICTEKPITLTENTPLDEIATIMSEKGVHTLPVTDEAGKLVGIVGRKDIIRTIIG